MEFLGTEPFSLQFFAICLSVNQVILFERLPNWICRHFSAIELIKTISRIEDVSSAFTKYKFGQQYIITIYVWLELSMKSNTKANKLQCLFDIEIDFQITWFMVANRKPALILFLVLLISGHASIFTQEQTVITYHLIIFVSNTSEPKAKYKRVKKYRNDTELIHTNKM